MLVEERPLWDDDQECKCGTAESDVEGLVDVLGDEAGEEGDGSHYGEQAICDVFGESLSFEVLHKASCQLQD